MDENVWEYPNTLTLRREGRSPKKIILIARSECFVVFFIFFMFLGINDNIEWLTEHKTARLKIQQSTPSNHFWQSTESIVKRPTFRLLKLFLPGRNRESSTLSWPRFPVEYSLSYLTRREVIIDPRELIVTVWCKSRNDHDENQLAVS